MGSVAQLRDPTSADPKWVPSREPYIVHSSLMTYTKAVKDLGGYRHAAYAEDTDLFWRLQQVGRLHILPETLVDYRVHAESISSTSPLNGRVSAAFSQLTGIGALRRRQQKPDLEFQQNDLARYKQAGTLLGIYNLAKQGLDDDEADYLEAAVAAKMLELVSYRPYELDIEDCYFIKRATNLWFPKLEPANKREVKRSWTGTAAQMALKRKWRETFALVPPRLYPEVGGRILFHLLFSKELKASVRSWLRTARKRDTKI